MSYHFTTTIDQPFDEAIETVTAALKEKGFGIMSTINVQKAMKEKIDKDINPYTILGACNPSYAYKALQFENKVGTMLPCNVVVQETAAGKIEVSAVDPVASMQGIDNPDLGAVAAEVQGIFKGIIESL